ncbi:hypothetical protein [Xanthomonas phage X1]|nr:hypothetical protein [Xanthomonas phage X1]
MKKITSHKEVRCKTPQELSDLIASLAGSEWSLAAFPSTFLDGTAQVSLVKIDLVEYKFTDTEMLDWMERNEAIFSSTHDNTFMVSMRMRKSKKYGALACGLTARAALEKAMINIKGHQHIFEDER